MLWQLSLPVWLSVLLNRLVVEGCVPSRLWVDWYAGVLHCVNRLTLEIGLNGRNSLFKDGLFSRSPVFKQQVLVLPFISTLVEKQTALQTVV